jgi:hypothetical protein
MTDEPVPDWTTAWLAEPGRSSTSHWPPRVADDPRWSACVLEIRPSTNVIVDLTPEEAEAFLEALRS